MTGLLNRFGVVGISLVAGALIFGVITGGIMIHRLENPAALVTTGGHHDQKSSKSSANSTNEQDKEDQQGRQAEQQDSKSAADNQSPSSKDKKDSD